MKAPLPTFDAADSFVNELLDNLPNPTFTLWGFPKTCAPFITHT